MLKSSPTSHNQDSFPPSSGILVTFSSMDQSKIPKAAQRHVFHPGNPPWWDGRLFLTWSAKDTAGDNLKKWWRSGEREGIVGEDDRTGGTEVPLAVTAQCQKHYFKELASQPAAGPWGTLWGQGGSMCHTGGVCVQYVHENNKYYLLLDVRVCAFACTRSQEGRGRRLILIISCQALGLALQTRWCKSKCVSGSCVCCSAASEGTSLGSVPDLAACGISGSATRAF